MSCDVAWLDTLAVPAAEGSPVVVTASIGGRVGARVALRSARPPAAWSAVLHHPETADDWLPASLGAVRAELLAPSVLYQALDVSIFSGLLHFRRQSVVSIDWLSDGDRVRTCWTTIDPAPWTSTTSAWDTGAAWQPPGAAMGGWDIQVLPDGGSAATYQLWADAQTALPLLQTWAMSRTLPDIILAYAARVELASAAPLAAPVAP